MSDTAEPEIKTYRWKDDEDTTTPDKRPMRSHIARGNDSAFPRFEDLSLTHPELQHLRGHSWATDAKTVELNTLGRMVFIQSHGHPQSASGAGWVGWRGDVLLYVRASMPHVSVEVAAKTAEECDEAIAEVLRMFPPSEPAPQRQQVSFKFWNTSSNGPNSNDRILDVPRWDEIEHNYAPSTRDLLSTMMKMDLERRSANEPKLLLWSGKPGGGKTYGIRALAWELRKHASFEYIIDPDSLFSDSSYFVDVLLDNEDAKDWRVLVMEDTGELLASDAKARTGQGLSRLLNVMDGLIGQGLRLMILITTNEDLGQLHPAVTRPGRCASNINFLSFQPPDANSWLASHGVERTVSKPHTLAELFANRHDEELKTNWENKAGVGFLAEELSVKS